MPISTRIKLSPFTVAFTATADTCRLHRKEQTWNFKKSPMSLPLLTGYGNPFYLGAAMIGFVAVLFFYFCHKIRNNVLKVDYGAPEQPRKMTFYYVLYIFIMVMLILYLTNVPGPRWG